MKKLLLLSFKYPPYAGVGGFRWANLSLRFADKGYIVHVVTVKWKKTAASSFLEVLNHRNIIIHRLPSLGFHNIRYMSSKNRVLDFIYKGIRFILKRLLKPLYFIDEAQQWHWIMIPYVKKLVKKEKIPTIIATGEPFTVNYFASKIKRDLGNRIRLIQDFRDPWNENSIYINTFGNLNRINKSKVMELFSLKFADVIVSVTKGLSIDFSHKSGKKVHTIYNGFNNSEINKIKKEKSVNKKDTLKIIYAGNFANGRFECLLYLLDYFVKYEERRKLFQLIIYSNISKREFPDKYSGLFNTDFLILKEKISYKKLLEEIVTCDYGLHLNSSFIKNSLSTKIYDYISLGIPIISLNYGDEIETMINEYNFGYSINIDKNNIDRIFDEIGRNKEFKINLNNVGKFNYNKIIGDYIKLVENS